VLRGDAAHLPLPDESVDLIITSPPYWALRSYSDGGEHYDGQIGGEETPREYLEALWECTREWVRVLKPEGSIFVNIGDKYSGHGPNRGSGTGRGPQSTALSQTRGPMEKSLLGLPWRYALGCIGAESALAEAERTVDDLAGYDRLGLGLILRRDIIWHKTSALPESVTDRCATRHEYLFHMVKQPRYFAAVDEIREPHEMRPQRRPNGHKQRQQLGVLPAQTHSTSQRDEPGVDGHPLGRLPGSVWEIAAVPLVVPEHIEHARCCGGRKRPGCEDGVDHHAAFPPALARKVILGWSPSAICLACGEGRRPISVADAVETRPWALGQRQGRSWHGDGANPTRALGVPAADRSRRITGYACACPDTTASTQPREDCPRCAVEWIHQTGAGQLPPYENQTAMLGYIAEAEALENIPHNHPPASPRRRERELAPTRPAVVVDPCGGTGTTALTASVLGRIGVTVDRSMDYSRLAAWRTSDPGERARALGVPKPPPVSQGQGSLFDDLEDAS
jgi:DNA modification methylase